MNCRNCNRPVPESSTMCHHCYQKNGHGLRERKKPKTDMYGATIYEVLPNKEKEGTRALYLNSLPEYINHQKQQKQITKNILLLVFGMLLGIPLFGVIFVPCVLFALQVPAIGIPLAVLIFVVFLTVTCFIFFKVIRSTKPQEQEKRKLDIHRNKIIYYNNRYVFGFSILDHTSHDDNGTDYYYAYYEIDKRNIRGLSYDERYGEYILLTHKPTYLHYSLPPQNEFRIPDVFDDHVLPTIFGCDMPPKNIPF